MISGEDLVERIRIEQPQVVAISGFGGAGKSTLAKVIAEEIQGYEIVSMDDFLLDRGLQRSSAWSCFDRDRLVREALLPLSRSQSAKFGVFDWAENRVRATKQVFGPHVIIEGCSALHPELVQFYDLAIWIELPIEVAVMRGMSRDRHSGADHDRLWKEVWGPNDLDYYDRFRPDLLADVIVAG